MPKIIKGSDNRIDLPQDFLQRRHVPEQMEYWLDEREGELLLRPRLPDARKLYVEVTTGCNLDCRTCIRHSWGDPIAHMTDETFQKILNGMDDLPDLERVVFTSFGEPLTQPHLLEWLAAVRAKDIQVTIGTNGLLLSEEVSRELIRLGVDRLMISMDGGRPETMQAIRGTDSLQIIRNIEKLNALKLEMGSLFPGVGFEFVIMRSNQDELDDLAKLAAELNISRVLVSNVLPYTEEMRAETLYGYAPQDAHKPTGWSNQLGAWLTWANMDLPRMHWGAERRCRFVQDKSIVISWDGKVSPCYALSHNYSYFAIDGIKKDVTRFSFGDVHQQSLAEIWMSEAYSHFRSEVAVYHFPSCPDCDLRDTCDLRLENEGCWGHDPSCADCLWAQDIIRCP